MFTVVGTAISSGGLKWQYIAIIATFSILHLFDQAQTKTTVGIVIVDE